MADWTWNNEDDKNEDDLDGMPKFNFGSKDGLIFLIDCSKSMLRREEDESSFEKCLKCAKSCIQSKIISSTKDVMGIVLYGTEKSNQGDFRNVFVLHDLAVPSAARVLELERLLADDDGKIYKANYGHGDAFSISDALWTCSNMFSNCTEKLGYKRVMLFTDNDNPHSNSQQLRRQAAAKVVDLNMNNIDVELMHLQPAESSFDPDKFWKDVLIQDDDEKTILPDPSERFDDLLRRLRMKEHKKRALCRVPLELGPGLAFSVGIYNLQRTCTAAPRIRMNKSNDELKTVTKQFIEETGEILMPQDMKKSQTYGGKKINFETEEIAEMKKFEDPAITLMGFKPRSCLKRYFHVRPAQFLYPDESSVLGSTTMFTALLKKCLERDVLPICRYIPRRNTPPRFAALLPQAEELDETNCQVAPPGFHCIFLPYADDFRKVEFDTERPRANQEQTDKAVELVKKMAFTYNPEAFENPALQTHYANIEAMALDRDAPEEIVDYTLPDDARIKKRAGQIIQDFKDLVFPAGYDPTAKKRPAPAGGSAAAAKKPKVEVDTSAIDLEKEARAGKLGKLTVPVLKDCIKKAKIPGSASKKADLIDAINKHYGV